MNFKTLTTIQAPHQKYFFFSFNNYNLAIHVVTLDSKVQDLTIESRQKSFHVDIYPTCNEVHI
jgi:hypothetical protein